MEFMFHAADGPVLSPECMVIKRDAECSSPLASTVRKLESTIGSLRLMFRQGKFTWLICYIVLGSESAFLGIACNRILTKYDHIMLLD